MERKQKNMTCFSNCKHFSIKCENKTCRAWFASDKYKNCSILASEEGPMTLQVIGDLFKLTRMRICQIEKNAINKIRNIIGT
jgi:hypothetical protein